jgi:predicted acyltransferase
MTAATPQRWLALDCLRGLSIIGMLMNINPGAWDHSYPWLLHARWAGMSPIDMVAPIFLFCIGAAIPLSMTARLNKGASKATLLTHIWGRAAALVLVGLFLNAYPTFDWAHLRSPGVLQRIGVTYGLVASFLLLTHRPDPKVNLRLIAITASAILLAYWALLAFVPVPGFGAPRFDPLGSWPAFVDRMVFGPDHMFKYWPVDGRIVFDAEGILSHLPVCFNLLLGAAIGIHHAHKAEIGKWPYWLMGLSLMVAAVAISPLCPIIKNIWTPSFALFSGGCALVGLCLVQWLASSKAAALLYPARIYGSNALLAYALSFLVTPFIHHHFATFQGPLSAREAIFRAFSQFLPPDAASLSFSLIMIGVIYAVLWVCYQRRWFLKL